jgi:hypothetical protein
MNREASHSLVERIPEPEIPAAQRYLECLATNPAYRVALSAPSDDEAVTEGDAPAIERAFSDIREGRVVPHDQISREFAKRCHKA